MGRNRKASAAHWGDDNVIELLAQLDRTVDGPRYSFANKNEKEIESIINSRLLSLEKKLKMQYTPNQIRRKLMDILKQGDINAEYNFRSVFSIGTSAMRSLDMNTKCMVQARLHDICMEGRQPRTSSQRLDSSLKLRRSTPGRRSTPPKREKNLRATPLGRARNWRGTTSITPSSASVSIKVTPFKVKTPRIL
jgi:hypothetical protein